MRTLPTGVLSNWRLSAPRQIAETATSTVWKVSQANGQPAALKLLHPDEKEEARGATYLEALAGHGAVRLLAREGQALLLEWCDGPSLGDLCRAGQDGHATEILCEVIQTLHGAPVDSGQLEPLALRMTPLTSSDPGGDHSSASRIARDLLASPVTAVALHGDLHHDNVLRSARGWLAIDPKGVRGDPAYETANAFRNPQGAGDLMFQPDRIAGLADRFSRGLGHPIRSVLGWAAAHCALSTFWTRDAGQDPDHDLRLLPQLLAAWTRTSP